MTNKKNYKRKSSVAGGKSSKKYFFFQAEDGIRYSPVTGVQTCALPIFFAMSYSGDEFPVELLDSYSNGYCLTLDYSDILETMNPILGEDDDQDS